MTPPESGDDRARVLLSACGYGLAALVAIGALLLIGLRHHDRAEVVLAPPPTKPPFTKPSSSSADSTTPNNQAQRTAKRRSEAIPAEPAPRRETYRLFAKTSFWNERLTSANATPSSAVFVQGLLSEVQREQSSRTGPTMALDATAPPIYRVRGDQAKVRVQVDAAGVDGAAALQRALDAVPMPRNAKASAPPASALTIWQPSTDRLWELSGAHKRSDGWHASWGGALRDVSKSRGLYTGAAWPGATRTWGAGPSGLPLIGGTILRSDLDAGRIDHALALGLPAVRAGRFAWPAQRTDGTGALGSLPAGAHLRLDPVLNIDTLRLPKLARMVAFAAQRYGLVVREQTGGAVTLFGESRDQYKQDPYQRYLQGRTPQRVLADFPWDRLQVLQMQICSAAPCPVPP
jgi:hypothetical protein